MTPEPPAYESNCDLSEIADRLGAASRVAVVTHTKPDGDAIGATLALARSLLARGVEATIIYHGPWPKRYECFLEETPVIHYQPGRSLPEVDVVVIVDTGAWSQLSQLRPHLEPMRDNAILIDHHRRGDDVAALRYIDPRAAAVCEPVAEVCRLLLGNDALPRDIAEPLFVGIALDTGWFKYSSVRPVTFRLAADMLDAGVDHAAIFRKIEMADRVPRLGLMQRALASLELLYDDSVALMLITRRDVKETHADPDDVSGLIDCPQTVEAIRVVCLVTELKPDVTKVSLRSKPSDDPDVPAVDVDVIAQKLGGGGHFHAAGAKVAKRYEDLLPTLREMLKPAQTP
ncbi:MAG: DHH family phosphoesterase [Phycisphaerales bacterium]|nr:DHH family phosphoesterase [Phycisphaerales bacterium]